MPSGLEQQPSYLARIRRENDARFGQQSTEDPQERSIQVEQRDRSLFAGQISELGRDGSGYPFTVLDPKAERIIRGETYPPVNHHETKSNGQ